MEKKYKILSISSPDITNASGAAAYTLHKEYSKKYDSKLLVRHTLSKEKNVISYFSNYNFQRIIQKIKFLFKKTKTKRDYYFFEINRKGKRINVNKVIRKCGNPDLIIVYFLDYFFTFQDLLALQKKTKAPIILYLMDLSNITGGCHYTWDCEEYKNTCQKCPAFINETDQKYAHSNLLHYQKIVSQMNITVVSGAEQAFQMAKQSYIYQNKRIEKINLAIDQTVFKKLPQNELRSKYNVNINKFVILFGSVNTDEKRKGKKYLFEALQLLKNLIPSDDIILLQIGKTDPSLEIEMTDYQIMNLGYISNEKQLSEVYNLADVFVVPSIQDGGPMMINQSICCGTQVVSFKVGVSTDLIIDGETGYIATVANSQELASGIKKIYDQSTEEREININKCLELAHQKLNLSIQTEKFIELYKKMI